MPFPGPVVDTTWEFLPDTWAGLFDRWDGAYFGSFLYFNEKFDGYTFLDHALVPLRKS
jgi:hypothetical protein